MEHLTLHSIYWVVAILLGCLGAPSPTATSNRVQRLYVPDFNIDLMRTEVNCSTADTEFWTPSTDNKCLLAAVQCVQAELKVVKAECGDPGEYLDDALNAWEMVKKDLISSQMSSNDETTADMCQCELMPLADFNTFLDKMESLIQLINDVLSNGSQP